MTEHVFEKLCTLVGCPSDESLERIRGLAKTLSEEPRIVDILGQYTDYTFPMSGINLSFDNNRGMFFLVCLHIKTAMVQCGNIKAYSGNLPFEIGIYDSEAEVERKCPGGTMSVKNYRTDIDLRPLEIQFHFQAPDRRKPGIGPRFLSMVSIEYNKAT